MNIYYDGYLEGSNFSFRKQQQFWNITCDSCIIEIVMFIFVLQIQWLLDMLEEAGLLKEKVRHKMPDLQHLCSSTKSAPMPGDIWSNYCRQYHLVQSSQEIHQ